MSAVSRRTSQCSSDTRINIDMNGLEAGQCSIKQSTRPFPNRKTKTYDKKFFPVTHTNSNGKVHELNQLISRLLDTAASCHTNIYFEK